MRKPVLCYECETSQHAHCSRDIHIRVSPTGRCECPCNRPGATP